MLKKLSLLPLAVLLCFAMVACGDDPAPTPDDPTPDDPTPDNNDVNKKPTVIIDMTRGENETNPNTGAPAFAIIAVLAAAALSFKK